MVADTFEVRKKHFKRAYEGTAYWKVFLKRWKAFKVAGREPRERWEKSMAMCLRDWGQDPETVARERRETETQEYMVEPDTFKGKRDRAILATLLYHGLRREEVCKLKVKDIQSREGVLHFRVHGRGGKIRFVPVQPIAQRLIENYLIEAGHKEDLKGSLFRPVKNNRTGELNRHLNPNSIYRNIVKKYGFETGLNTEVNGLCVHAMRATAATNALSHDADIAKVQEWLGHASIETNYVYRDGAVDFGPISQLAVAVSAPAPHSTLTGKRTIMDIPRSNGDQPIAETYYILRDVAKSVSRNAAPTLDTTYRS